MPTSRNTTRNKICFLCQKAEDKGNTVDDLDPTELVALEDYLNKYNEENSEEVQSESDSDEEPENLVDLSFHQLTSLIESSPLKLSSDVKAVVEKVRTTVRKYRKSPLKDEVLQGYIKADHGQPKALVLDVKTKWSSLCVMLDTFLKVFTQIMCNESPN